MRTFEKCVDYQRLANGKMASFPVLNFKQQRKYTINLLNFSLSVDKLSVPNPPKALSMKKK